MVAAALAEVAKTKAVLPAHTDFTVICPGLCLGRTSKDAKKGVTHAPAAEELPSSSAGLAKAQDPPRTESALQVVSQTSRPSPRLSSCRVGAVAPMPSLKSSHAWMHHLACGKADTCAIPQACMLYYAAAFCAGEPCSRESTIFITTAGGVARRT